MLCLSQCAPRLLPNVRDGQSVGASKSDVHVAFINAQVVLAFILHVGCQWEREERNGHGDPEKAVWRMSMQGCCSSRSSRRTTAGPVPWDAVPQFRIRTHLTNIFSRWEPSSPQEAFSPSYLEPPCCRRVSRSPRARDQRSLLRRASLTPGVRMRGRSCTWSAQPWTKALSPALKGECKTKETARGRQKTPPPAGVRSFGILYMRFLSHPAFSGKRKQLL